MNDDDGGIDWDAVAASMDQQPDPSLPVHTVDDLEVVGTQTAADRTRRTRDAAISLDLEANGPAAAAGNASGGDGGSPRPQKRQRTAGAARAAAAAAAPAPVEIKRELTSDAKREQRELEKWYLQERIEQIRPGDPFFAADVPAREQRRQSAPRINKYPRIAARLADMVADRASGVRLKKLLLLRQLRAWEQFGVGRDGYAAPMSDTGSASGLQDTAIELLDSDDDEVAAAAAVADCSAIAIDEHAMEHWDVLFVRWVKVEVDSSGSGESATSDRPAAVDRRRSALVAVKIEAEIVGTKAAAAAAAEAQA